jgi:ABC-type Zn2+ transport system substrate-binding protein/surface adhesin
MPEDNSHAGQGPVVLDIGGDIGALIIAATAELAGHEIELRPVGGAALARYQQQAAHHHSHEHDHSHEHGHSHEHSHHPALVHVAVVGRPAGGQLQYSAVFGELTDGQYECYLRPDGPVVLASTVRGGQVTEQVWPG